MLANDIYRNSFAETPHPHLLVDRDARILAANPAMLGMFQCSRTSDCNSTENGCFPQLACRRTIFDLLPDEQTFFDNGVYSGEYHRTISGIRDFLGKHVDGQLDLETLLHGPSDDVLNAKMAFRSVHREQDGGTDAGQTLVAITNVTRDKERDTATRLEIFDALNRTAEARDNETGLHMCRIGRYAAQVSREVGLPSAFCQEIERLAPFHDIGKVGVPDEILLAPRKLTAEEFEAIKTHTTIGNSILSGSPTLQMAAEIAMGHHERFDGSGYPQGVAGGSIPVAARIVAIVDVYDALRSRRPYKEPWTHEDAISTIAEGIGTHFCNIAGPAFLKAERTILEISEELAD